MPDFSTITRFSLFRNRGPKGFHIPARYYDAAKEAQRERELRLKQELSVEALSAMRRERLAERIRHSWHRRSSDTSRSKRLLVVLGFVASLAYILYKGWSALPS